MCTSVGGPDNTYQWQANDTDITGETMENLTLTNVDASTGGMYTCVVTNVAGSDFASIFLFITPYFITEPVNEETSDGSSVILECFAEAFPSPEYLWARTDGAPIRGELMINSANLNFDPVLFGDEGDYYCNVTSRDEVAHSLDATLTGEFSAYVATVTVYTCAYYFSVSRECHDNWLEHSLQWKQCSLSLL